jgi:hypothetical protein
VFAWRAKPPSSDNLLHNASSQNGELSMAKLHGVSKVVEGHDELFNEWTLYSISLRLCWTFSPASMLPFMSWGDSRPHSLPALCHTGVQRSIDT